MSPSEIKKMIEQINEEFNFTYDKLNELYKQLQEEEIEEANLIDEVGARKSDHLKEILKAKDPHGKPLYTNETQRELALKDRLSSDVDYQVAVKNLRATQNKIREIKRWVDSYRFKLKFLISKMEALRGLGGV